MKTLEQRLRNNQNQKLYEERHRHPCPLCGMIIGRRSSLCHSCSTKERWKQGHFREAQRYNNRGARHPKWKGGHFIRRDGYIYLYNPDTTGSNDRYIAEHRVIWEKANNKKLPKGWVIHHLNGIRYDNRLTNLVALSNKKHYLVLAAKAKRIQELEAILNHQAQLL